MKSYNFLITALLLSFLFQPVHTVQAQTHSPVVRAVLFYSPTCGHCEYVIKNVLLPLVDQYGDQLQIFSIDVTQQQGQALFLSTLQKFDLETAGVPFLAIDDKYLIGSSEIPEKFPELVKTYLAQGGIDWPDLPGLSDAILQAKTAEALTTAPSHAASSSLTATPGILGLNTERNDWRTRFAQDSVGNTLALLVLIGMFGSIMWAVLIFKDTTGVSIKESWDWIIPLLSLIGFAVAGYLAYVETFQVEAVCGPVGDCNTVQQSEYARLFGVLPIGVLGLVGYALIFIAWLASRYAKGLLSDLAVLSMFIMTAFGILLSIYLTFLEPFVIGASCAWCLSSAILMTLLMLLSVRPAKVSYARISQIQPKPLPGGTS